MQLDQVTESIAHFIGLFNVQIEKDRARESYDEFQALRESEDDLPGLPDINIRLIVPYEFENWDPNLRYKGPQDETFKLQAGLDPESVPPEFRYEVPLRFDDPAFRTFTDFGGPVRGSGKALPPELHPPGSMALVVKQHGNLEDNDYINTTGFDVAYVPITQLDYHVELLWNQLLAADPIGVVAPPGSEEAIADIIAGIAQSLRDMVPDESTSQVTSVFFRVRNWWNACEWCDRHRCPETFRLFPRTGSGRRTSCNVLGNG